MTTSNKDLSGCFETTLVVEEFLAGDRLSIAQAARMFPPGRQERPCSPATVWRWMRDGAKDSSGRPVRLEAARVGCRLFTSAGAVRRFLSKLNPAGEGPPTRRYQRADRQVVAHEQAVEDLRKLGV